MAVSSRELIYLHQAGGHSPAVFFWPAETGEKYLVFLNGLESNHAWFAGIAGKLAELGANVMALDRRGTALNAGLKGRVGNWLGDIDRLVDWIEARQPRAVVHLSSLCYGALLATRFAQRQRDRLASLVFISPGLKIRVHPSFTQIVRAGLWSFLGKKAAIGSPIRDESLFSSHTEAQEWIRGDKLRKYDFSLGELLQTWILRWGLHGRNRSRSMPVLLLLAEHDRIINKDKNIQLLKRLFPGRISVREYAGTSHCLLFEPGIDLPGDIWAWMNRSEP